MWQIYGWSAHADRSELLRWVNKLQQKPERTFLVHGEMDRVQAMQKSLEGARWNNVHIPDYQETHMLFKGI